jgi:hypothetical protein
MAWDVCRLGDADPPRREDKMRYLSFLNDGPAARLGADPQTPDLVAVCSLRRSCQLAAAKLLLSRGQS